MEMLQAMPLVYKLAILSLFIAVLFRVFLGELLSGMIKLTEGKVRKCCTVALYVFLAYVTLSILAAPTYFIYTLF
jgi:hypothetical protein